jgi:hypothetical protein
MTTKVVRTLCMARSSSSSGLCGGVAHASGSPAGMDSWDGLPSESRLSRTSIRHSYLVVNVLHITQGSPCSTGTVHGGRTIAVGDELVRTLFPRCLAHGFVVLFERAI